MVSCVRLLTDCASPSPFLCVLCSAGVSPWAGASDVVGASSSVGELLRGGNGGGAGPASVGVVLRLTKCGLPRGDIIGLTDVWMEKGGFSSNILNYDRQNNEHIYFIYTYFLIQE